MHSAAGAPPSPLPPQSSPPAELSAAPKPDLVTESWRILNEWFIDPPRLPAAFEIMVGSERPADTMGQHALIRRMLTALNTSHTDLYTADQPEYIEALDIYAFVAPHRIETMFPGGNVSAVRIGVTTTVIDQRHFARFVWEGGPADIAGVQIGDELIAVDGQPFHPVHAFRGHEDDTVQLTIRRTRSGETLQIDVTPHRLSPGDAFARALTESVRVVTCGGKRIGYARVHSYAGSRFHEILLNTLECKPIADADALVLDLRGGWGGASPEYALDLVGRAAEMTMTDRDGKTIHVSAARVQPEKRRWHRPLVVLIDDSVRSGKEVLAATLKQAGVPLVGLRTAGAVLGGKPFLLEDDSLLIIAVTDVTVNGARLEGVGVEPTIAVPFELPYAAGHDPQFDRAIAEAARRVGAHGE